MKHALTLAIIATLCAGQASALSCMRPDVARTFSQAAASDDSYVVLFGAFTFDAPPTSRSANINAPTVHQRDAVFAGQYLGADGFTDAPLLDVLLTFECAGPWCGSMSADGQPTLAFAKQTASGFELVLDPCGTSAFPNPTRDQITRIEGCMRGEECAEAALQ